MIQWIFFDFIAALNSKQFHGLLMKVFWVKNIEKTVKKQVDIYDQKLYTIYTDNIYYLSIVHFYKKSQNKNNQATKRNSNTVDRSMRMLSA